MSFRAELVLAGVDPVGQARIEVDAARRDSARVLTGEVAAAAQLQHLEDPHLTLEGRLRHESDDRVGHRELGSVYGTLAAVLAYPEGRGRDRGEAPGEVVEESPEVRLVGGEGAEGFEAVDDNNSRLVLLDQAVDR